MQIKKYNFILNYIFKNNLYILNYNYNSSIYCHKNV